MHVMKDFLRNLFVVFGVLGIGIGALPSTQASVLLAGTRVIYPASARQVSVRLTNAGRLPSLVQVWVDRAGDVRKSPFSPDGLADAPFLVTPPIFRIDAGSSQVLRLRFAGESLPSDRESVFWLNVLDIPPEPETLQGGESFVQLNVRTRIKIFYRPDAMAGAVADTVRSLTWQVIQPQGQGTTVLRVSNPGGYHVSFNSIALHAGDTSLAYERGGMVAPGGSMELELSGALPRDAGATRVRFQWINDYGAGIDEDVALGAAH